MGLMTINVVVASETSSGRPKLVVGIVVDQLRSDYLDYLKDLFGEKGFRQLMQKGVYVKDVILNADLNDPASATGVLYTGAFPGVNGVPSSRVFSPSDAKAHPALEDKNSMGNYTRESLSPANLRVSTLSDEIAINGVGANAVYAIAPDAQQAIIMAGHAGNCALWINDDDGQWSSTAYYRDFPQFITRRNRGNSLRQQLDTLRWTPALSLDSYPGISITERTVGFRHSFNKSDRDVYRSFKTSAPVNKEITDVAISALKELALGKHKDAVDILSIGYTAAPFQSTKGDGGELELKDTYVRLDAQLARLLDEVDHQVGLSNSVIFITSTGYYNDSGSDDEKFRIPTGNVTLRRIESLLNSYLSAKYGNGDYVKGVKGNQIYLNMQALEQKAGNSEAAIRDARDFIVKMSGIANARTLTDVLSDMTEEGIRMRNSIDPKTSGEIILTFSPGWNVVDDFEYPESVSHQRLSTPPTPFLLLAPGVEARTLTAPIDARAIAPTITSTIHIRAPNGASVHPVIF